MKELNLLKELSSLAFTVTSVTNDQQLIERAQDTDLLVVSKVSGFELPPFINPIDQQVNGYLRQLSRWPMGRWGSYRLVNLESQGLSLGRTSHVLMVGLGSVAEFHCHRLCGFIGFVLDKAHTMRLKKVAFIESPYRPTENGPSLLGTGAWLRCRAEAHLQHHVDSTVQEIEVLCCPQAARYFEKGMAIESPRCRQCSYPQV